MRFNKYILIIIILSLGLIGSLTLALRTTIFQNRAATVNNSPVVLENSYIFASPIQAKADGKEQVRITVYILDGRGLGVPNQKVNLNLSGNIKVNIVQSTSDDTGKTIFDLSSLSANTYNISASTNGKELPQKVKVTFY